MTTINIRIADKKQASMLCEMLRSMKFVKEVGIVEDEEAEELKILEERLVEYQAKPSTGIPWAKVKKEFGKKYGK